MAENVATRDPEILKLQRDAQEKQRDHCRDRIHQIFSWASGLMVGGIAGLFAITSGRGWSVAWPPDFALRNNLVGLTIGVFVGYSMQWITEYVRKKDVAQANID